jgi:hypothetical protein
MNELHKYFALLLASSAFILSFLYKYVIYFDMNLKMVIKDFILFFVVYIVSKNILSYVEDIFNIYRKLF